MLVDLKYITPSQRLQIEYEGRMRYFAVSSTSTAKSDTASSVSVVTQAMDALSVNAAPRLSIVTWDTLISISDLEPAPPEPTGISTLRPLSSPTAYAAVGGLDSQISQVRDLIEIPLTRPGLFRQFGGDFHLTCCGVALLTIS